VGGVFPPPKIFFVLWVVASHPPTTANKSNQASLV
jgi:hypothetical protein